jgi:hypothetical protein
MNILMKDSFWLVNIVSLLYIEYNVMYLGPYCNVVCLLLLLLVDYNNFDVLRQVLYLMVLALYECFGTFNKYNKIQYNMRFVVFLKYVGFPVLI